MNSFSYKEYKKIIDYYRKELKLVKLENIRKSSKNFFFIRHDVEFSVNRAFELAKFEKKVLNVNSYYFF